MRAVLKAQINKTDRNAARGIAQMIRAGLYRPVHVKTLRSQKLHMLLTSRKLLQSKAIAIENDLRATLRNFGLKVGMEENTGVAVHRAVFWRRSKSVSFGVKRTFIEPRLHKRGDGFPGRFRSNM